MKLIIDISDEDYKIMKHNIAIHNPLCPLDQEEMVQMVANGVPVPENSKFKDIKKESWVWKPKGYNLLDGNLGDWYCSECKRTLEENVPKYNVLRVIEYDFCPFCGSEKSNLDFSDTSSGQGV